MKSAFAWILCAVVVGTLAVVAQATEFPLATSGLQVEGNKAIRTDDILRVIPFRGGEVISESTLKQASQAIFNLGWFSTVVPEVDDAGVVRFRVTENPVIQKYDISGNTNLETFALFGLTLFRAPIISTDRIRGILSDNDVKIGKMLNNTSLKNALDAILKAYTDKGYALIMIGKVDTSGPTLKIQVIEGRVSENSITGLVTIPDSVARAIINLPTGECVKKAALQEIFTRLRASVFFSSADIAPQQGATPDSVRLVWTLGERTLLSAATQIKAVDLEGVTLFPNAIAASSIQALPDGPVDNYHLLQALGGLFDLYHRTGYVMVRFTNVGLEAGRLRLRVEEGEIGQVTVKGNTHTQESVILRNLGLKTGQVLNSGRLGVSYQGLMALGYFTSVDIVPEWVDDQVHVSVTIVEGTKLGGFNGSISYSPESGGLVGKIEYSQKNLFGTGQDLSFSYDRGLVGDATAVWDLGYSTVSFFPQFKRVGVNLYSKSEEKTVPKEGDSQEAGNQSKTYYTLGAKGSVTYPWSDYTDLDVSYKNEAVRPADKSDWEPLNSVTLALRFDDVNNPRFPSNGSRRVFSVEKAGGFAPGAQFTKLDATWTSFSPVLVALPFLAERDQVVAVRLSCGLGLGLPPSQRYDLGGSTTIRGVGTSSVDRLCFANLEYRVAIVEGLTATAFADCGVNLDRVSLEASKGSVGIELGIDVAGMFVRLDMAWPLGTGASWVPRFDFGFGPMF